MSMSLPPSSGSGGDVGSQFGPTHRELETTAAAAYARASMGITTHSEDEVFTQTNLLSRPGVMSESLYRSTADRPVLSHSLESVRVQLSSKNEDDEAQPKYEELVASLPEEMQQKLVSESKLPMDQRNSAYTALNTILETTAKILTTIDNTSKPTDPNSLEAARQTLNLAAPGEAYQAALGVHSEVNTGVQQFLTQQGPNYRDFDSLNNVLGQINKSATGLGKLSEALTQAGSLTSQEKNVASKLADQLVMTQTQFDHLLVSDEMQIIKPMIQALILTARSLTLPEVGSAPLYLTLSTASIGLNVADSKTGMVGEQTANGIKGATDTILDSNATKLGIANHQLLNMSTTALMLLLTGLASQSVSPGFGLLPNQLPHEETAAHFFEFSAALSMIASSNVVGTVFQELLGASGADAKTQAVGSNILTQVAHLLMIQAGIRQEGHQAADDLIAEQHHSVQSGIHAADELTSHASNVSAAVSVALHQMQAALENKDYAGVQTSLNQLMSGDSANPNSWLTEFDASRQVTTDLTATGSSTHEDQPLTGIINIV